MGRPGPTGASVGYIGWLLSDVTGGSAMSYGAGEGRPETVSNGARTGVDRRIADLEAQVARLEAGLAAIGSAGAAPALGPQATARPDLAAPAISASAAAAPPAVSPA